MGDCLSRTRIEKYGEHFDKLHLGELNDLWSTIKTYKIKQLFGKEARAEDSSIDLIGFRNLLPGLEIYSDNVVRRIFQIFDRDERLSISFANFLRGLSICNFGPDEIMLAIIYMIYDELLDKKLTVPQVIQLYTDHKRFLLEPELMQQDDFLKEMFRKGEDSIEVDDFIRICQTKKMFNLDDYRRIYSVFPQERIEKELAENFNEWNKLYSVTDEKFISYVLSYKWFEAWKIYAEGQYKMAISMNADSQPTKRKTMFRSRTIINTLKTIAISVKKDKNEDNGHCKTLNFVHGDIGEKPREIDNSVLEGQYEGILNGNLMDSDFMLVSEKVWNYFHSIYEGGPVFRRTGVEKIEMQPKLVKIYSSLFKDKLDYSSQVVRQVPCSISTFQILTQSIEIPEDTIQNYCFYSKVIDGKWQRIPDLHLTLEELHNDVLLFLVYLPMDDELTFINNHVNIQHSKSTFNIGDVMDVSLAENQPKRKVVYLGINNQGRHILHLVGQTYKTDLCVDDDEFERLIGNNVAVQPKTTQAVANLPQGVRCTSGSSFISSVLPILNSIPEFLSILLKGTKQIQLSQKSIAKEMASIFQKLGRSSSVSSRGLVNILHSKLPALTNNYENYISVMLTELEKELQAQKLPDTIRELTGIRYKIIKECQNCKSKSEQTLSTLGMEIKVPLGDIVTYQVTYVPYSQSMSLKEIKKYAFGLHRGSKLSDYKKKLQDIIGLADSNYMIAEVFQNNIIKNFSTAEESETLQKLHLREADDIYVYDLFVDFETFVKEHYRTNREMDLDDVKINHFIDCSNQDQGWIFGKVCSIEYLTYTKRTIVSVIHKINRFEEWKIGYDLFEIALFPTKSYQNCEQFLLRVNQRRFNESTNNMEHIGMPLVVTLPEWMRWKEFFFLMYLQMKRFIVDDEDHGENEAEELKLKSGKTIKQAECTRTARKKTTIKLEQKKKLNKFKEYLNSEEFPYKLNLVDMEGRCAVCFRFVKDTLFKGEGDSFCNGCKVSESDPISWQIKCTEVMICVDWKKTAKVKKDEQIVKSHPSVLNTLQQHKVQAVNLTECLERHFKLDTIDIDDSPCCHQEVTLSLTKIVEKNPEYLFITLDKTLEYEGFKKRMDKIVKYENSLTGIGKKSNYDLYGVIYLDGPNRFKSLLQVQKGNWIEYDGEFVSNINKKDVLMRKASILVYKAI